MFAFSLLGKTEEAVIEAEKALACSDELLALEQLDTDAG